MVQHTPAFHHLQQRRRLYLKREKFPHPDKYTHWMDTLIYVAAVLGPLLTLPQAFKIWFLQEAEGVSLISWVSYLFAAGFWTSYGVMHKEPPIIIAHSVWVLIDLAIVVGIVFYG